MSGCNASQASADELTVHELISARDVARRVQELGDAVSAVNRSGPLHLVVVLHGAFFFAAELARAISVPLTFDFIRVASYSGAQSGTLRLLQDLTEPIGDRDVLIVEDIVDTGQTLEWLLARMLPVAPRSLRSCALLSRRHRAERVCTPDFVGFEIGPEFVVGCGLDYNGRFRELEYVGTIDLAATPEICVRVR
ncbi:MAG: hypoxanthine phosphoribosyltransferase [Armatimonadetes bacterium]|nr:hypoxanthine phosphoribosyltransferase [Armatimonadota bacterium]MDE2206594.1 hypoxanthine phosphoribosyltransferase [Armatimonadota bacterium]